LLILLHFFSATTENEISSSFWLSTKEQNHLYFWQADVWPHWM